MHILWRHLTKHTDPIADQRTIVYKMDLDLSPQFKLANYLMQNVNFYHTLVEAIRFNKNPPPITAAIHRVRNKYGLDMLRKHPETLVDGMFLYLGRSDTWNILHGIFKTCERSDYLIATIDLYKHNLTMHAKYDGCKTHDIGDILRDALGDLTTAELERVKLLLSWRLLDHHYGYLPGEDTRDADASRLTEQIVTVHCERAVYLMCLIFTYIQRPDLVEKLTAITRVLSDTEATPDGSRRGNGPR